MRILRSPAIGYRLLLVFLLTAIVWPSGPGAVLAADPPFSAVNLTDDRFGMVFVNSVELEIPDSRYQQARDAGARWTRWPFYWHRIETAPGRLDNSVWAKQDQVVARDRAAGLEINGVIVGTPDWAASGGNPRVELEELGAGMRMLGMGMQSIRTQELGGVTTPPRNLRAPVFLPNGEINPDNYWARFVYTTVSRYKGKVAMWEVWNEPDLKDFNHTGVYWNGSDDDYYWLLKVAYLAIKKADPSARVGFSGLAYWTDQTFLPRLLDIIVRDPEAKGSNFYFDVVNYHFYTNPYHLYNLPIQIRGELNKRGMQKPIWVNETNLPICDDKQVDPTLFCPSQFRGTMTEQAGFVLKAFALSLAAGVERVFAFQFYDDDVGPHDWYGLVRNDGTPRPAYRAYQTAGKYLSWATRADRDVFGRTDAVVLRGTPHGKVTLLWARGQRNDVAKVVAQSSSAILVDTQGNERPIRPVDGAYLIPVAGGNPDNGGGDPLMLVEPVFPAVTTKVTALPPQTATTSINVGWGVIEGNAPAGLRYDVDFRQGPQGRWTRWLSDTPATSAVFGAAGGNAVWPGQTYAFRVRARLPGGDAERLHPGDGDTATTVSPNSR